MQAALAYFTSDDVDRNTFVTIGHVIRHEFGKDGYKVYADWLAKSPDDDPDITRAIWDGLRGAPHSMTVGTIFGLAIDRGWEPPWRSDALSDFNVSTFHLDDDDFDETRPDDEDFRP